MFHLPKYVFVLAICFLLIAVVILTEISGQLNIIGVPLIHIFLPKAGSCYVLEEKYCKQLKPVRYNGFFKGWAIRVPNNTRIFTPFDGDVLYTTTYKFQENGVTKRYQGLTVSTLYIDGKPQILLRAIYFDPKKQPNDPVIIKKGAIISSVSDKSIDVFGNYNLVLDFQEYDKTVKKYTSSETLNKRFLKL